MADITAIYTKHATSASHDDRPELVKNIMVDLMEYFHQRAIQDNSSENVQPRNIGEASVSGGLSRGCQMNDGNDRDNDYDGNVPQVSSPFEEFHEDVHTASPGTIGAQVDRNVAPQVERSAAADVDKSGAPAVERSAAADVDSSAAAAVERSVAADVERSATSTLLQSVHGIGRHCDVPFQYTTTNATLPDNNNVAMSGDTEIIPSSGQGSETAPLDSNAETEIVNPASDGDDSSQFQSKRRRTSTASTDTAVHTVATRTRGRMSSLSPSSSLNEVCMVDNPEAILRKRCVRTLASTKTKSPLCPSAEGVTLTVNEVDGSCALPADESSSQRNRTKVLTSQANVVHVDKVTIPSIFNFCTVVQNYYFNFDYFFPFCIKGYHQ